MRKEIRNAVSLALQANIPVMLHGSPGIGKTSMVTEQVHFLGMTPLVTIIASIREPSDFLGLPFVDDVQVPLEQAIDLDHLDRRKKVRFIPGEWAYRLKDAGRGTLFFDELPTAAPANQNAVMRIILEGVVGEETLPSAVRRIAAGNSPEESAGWYLTPPLANRFLHLHCKVDPAQWVENFIPYWGHPPKIEFPEENWSYWRLIVASFVKVQPQLLLQVPKEEDKAGGAWSSPRTMDLLSRALTAADLLKADEDTRMELVFGSIGEGIGLQFLTWLRDLNLPDPEELLKDPSSFILPARGDQAFAALVSVAFAVQNRPNQERYRAAWKIMKSAAAQGAIDVAAVAVKQLLQLKSDRRQLNLRTAEEDIEVFYPLLISTGMLKSAYFP